MALRCWLLQREAAVELVGSYGSFDTCGRSSLEAESLREALISPFYHHFQALEMCYSDRAFDLDISIYLPRIMDERVAALELV